MLKHMSLLRTFQIQTIAWVPDAFKLMHWGHPVGENVGVLILPFGRCGLPQLWTLGLDFGGLGLGIGIGFQWVFLLVLDLGHDLLCVLFPVS